MMSPESLGHFSTNIKTNASIDHSTEQPQRNMLASDRLSLFNLITMNGYHIVRSHPYPWCFDYKFANHRILDGQRL